MKTLWATMSRGCPYTITFTRESFLSSTMSNNYSFSASIDPPSVKDFHKNYIHVAEIRLWNGSTLYVYWHTYRNEVVFKIDNTWTVQDDHVTIVESLANLFSCEKHHLRFNNLTYVYYGAPCPEINEIEDIWRVYDDNWCKYGEYRTLVKFAIDIDVDDYGFPLCGYLQQDRFRHHSWQFVRASAPPLEGLWTSLPYPMANSAR